MPWKTGRVDTARPGKWGIIERQRNRNKLISKARGCEHPEIPKGDIDDHKKTK